MFISRVFLIVLLIVGVFGNTFLHQAASLNGWTKSSRARSYDMVKLTFIVKQKNVDQLDQILADVSDPKSSSYGQYLTHAEVGALTSNMDAANAVQAAVSAAGAIKTSMTKHGEFVTALFFAPDAEKVLGTKFHSFKHPEHEATIVRSMAFIMPESLVEHVSYVAGAVEFPTTKSRTISSLSMDAGQPPVTTPDLIKSHYGIEKDTVTNPKATQSLFEALGQDFSPADLRQFQKKFRLKQTKITKVIGPENPGACKMNPEDCGEANLDVQYMMAVAQNSPTTYWSIDKNSEDPFMDWVKAAAATGDELPLVHSISYGGSEEYIPQDLADAFNNEIKKLGIRGITVVVSSGDDGAGSSQVRESKRYCGYSPSYPATSPFVTAVGATQGPEANQPEVGCSSSTGGLITTGGGFSTLYATPSYQQSHVDAYLSKSSAPAGFNRQGRGYPDIATLGHNYVIVDGGKLLIESGTSASAPVFGAMVTLINDARMNAGKSPLGFLNPALYSLDSSVFNDITEGSNFCAAGEENPNCCKEGFTATAGWDPVSGLGSPKFAKMMDALLAL